MDERRVPRTAIFLAATLRREKIFSRQVAIVDFTRLGCRVVLDRSLRPGTFVTLNIPAFTDIGGWVAWTKAGQVGIDFAHPLPTAVSAHIVRLGQGQDGHDPVPSATTTAECLVLHLLGSIMTSTPTPIHVAG